MVKDARIITTEDKIINVEFSCAGDICFVNENFKRRIVSKDGKIRLDFCELIQYETLIDGTLLVLDSKGNFSLIDPKDNVVFQLENVRSFDYSGVIILKMPDKVIAIDENGNILLDENEKIEDFRFNPNGKGLLKIKDQEYVYIDGDKEYDLSELPFEHIEQVYLGASGELTVVGKKIDGTFGTVIYKEMRPLFESDRVCEVYSVENGVLVVKEIWDKSNNYYVYANDGQLLEAFYGKNIDLAFERSGVVFKKKNGVISYRTYKGDKVIDFKDDVIDIIFINDELYILLSKRHFWNFLENPSYFYDIIDINNVIPDYCKNDIAWIKPFDNGGFLISRAWKNTILAPGRHMVYRSDTLFNKKGYQITSEFAIEMKPIEQIRTFGDIFEVQVDGATWCYDQEGNRYKKPPLIGPNGEIFFITENGFIETHKLPKGKELVHEV